MATAHSVSTVGHPRTDTLRNRVESITDRIHLPAEQWARDHGLIVRRIPGRFGWLTRREYRHPLFEGKAAQRSRQPIAPHPTQDDHLGDRHGRKEAPR